MFSRISRFVKAILFFLRFATTIIVVYLLTKGAIWLLQQPIIVELKRSSINAWDFLERLETAVQVSGGLFVITWGLHFLDRYIFGQRLKSLGRIGSKSFFPIFRMFSFPFFHGNIPHLFGTVKLTVLFAGLFVMFIPSLSLLLQVGFIMFVVQGFGVWIFGKKGTAHVGSSGLMLGFFTFDVLFGILKLGWQTPVAFLLLYFFGKRMFNSLMNSSPGISVVGHMWGAASGLIATYFVSPFGPLSIY